MFRVLCRRLENLVDAGMPGRRLYCEEPERHEYVLAAFKSFGERHYPNHRARL